MPTGLQGSIELGSKIHCNVLRQTSLKGYLGFLFFPYYSLHFCTQLFVYWCDYFLGYATRNRILWLKRNAAFLGKKLGLIKWEIWNEGQKGRKSGCHMKDEFIRLWLD